MGTLAVDPCTSIGAAGIQPTIPLYRTCTQKSPPFCRVRPSKLMVALCGICPRIVALPLGLRRMSIIDMARAVTPVSGALSSVSKMLPWNGTAGRFPVTSRKRPDTHPVTLLSSTTRYQIYCGLSSLLCARMVNALPGRIPPTSVAPRYGPVRIAKPFTSLLTVPVAATTGVGVGTNGVAVPTKPSGVAVDTGVPEPMQLSA